MKDTTPSPTPNLLPSVDWAALVFRPLVISGLVTCIAAGWVMLLEDTLGWQSGYLVLLVALVTLETLLAEQQLRARHIQRTHRSQVRLAEIGLMLILVKLSIYLQRGWAAFWMDIRRWLYQPDSFFNGDYVIRATAILMMWLLAMDIAGCLAELSDTYSSQDRTLGLAGLKDRFMLGAFILLMAVGLRHVSLSPVGLKMLPAQASALTWLPLIYFGLGLLLFGQARLMLLQAGWEREQVPVAPSLSRRWAGWGLLFVGGVTALALLMPAGDTLAGAYALAWLMSLFMFVARVVFFIPLMLLLLLLSPCLALFQMQQVSQARPQLPSLPPPPTQTAGPAWLFYLRLALFWIVVAVILFFLLQTLWLDRQAAGSWRLWRGWFGRWRAFWAWLLRWKKRVEIQFRRLAGEPTSEVQEAKLSWWQRWRARTAREQVRRLYLALLSRAAKAGHPRHSIQTPFEYAAELEPRLAGEGDALETLTSAFVQARYSRRMFQPEEVSFLRRVWRRLQAALRKL